MLIDRTKIKFISRGLGVGVLVGIVISAFRLLIEFGLTQVKLAYQKGGWWLVALVVINILIAAIVGRLLQHQPEISGSGIPQVEGQLAGELELPWWGILWRKFVGGVLSLAPGLFLGREGPSIQLGAAVGQGLAEKTGLQGSDRRVMIASGAAAGLSAAFNAPIAGTMFVLEEIYHNFSPLVWLTSLTSAVLADFVAINVFGLTPVLHLDYNGALPIRDYGHLLVLGILLGVLGRLYQKVLLAQPKWFGLVAHWPRAFHGMIPLLLVIPVGILWPQLLGGGNAVILHFDQVTPGFWTLLSLFVIRFIFSMISYGSGLPGGIFLPILTLGALIGGAYAVAMAQLGWLARPYIINLVIVGMAGYFAGIGKAPFTAILLITEMVGNLTNLLPLAIVSLMAYLTVDALGGAPIYAAMLARLSRRPFLASAKMSTIEVTLFEGSALEDQQVRDYTWPTAALLVGIRRGEETILPHGDTVMRAGDTLIIHTPGTERQAVRAQIRRVATGQNGAALDRLR